ncbi:MAG: GNAT family N-acetyltransferase [Cyanobacteria bacterium P01_A01_bin.84]
MIEVPIITERLIIRPFDPQDIDGYLRFMLDKESTKFLTFAPEQTTEEGAKSLFEYVIQAYGTPDIVHAYAIADKVTNVYMGSCGFAPYENGIVECYYCVNPEYRGQGIAVEAMKAAIAVLADIVEIRAYCHPDNTLAHVVATRCKMKHIGLTQHKHLGFEGEMFVYECLCS